MQEGKDPRVAQRLGNVLELRKHILEKNMRGGKLPVAAIVEDECTGE